MTLLSTPKPPLPRVAKDAEDAYFTPAQAAPCKVLRQYTALELMYGYYLAE